MTFETDGYLVGEKRDRSVGDTVKWDVQTDWEAYQELSDIQIPGDFIELATIGLPASSIAHYDATTINSTGSLSTWADTEGSADLTGTASVIDNGINGLRTVRFNGTDETLSTSGFTATTEPFGWVMVTHIYDTGGTDAYYFDDSSTTRNFLINDNAADAPRPFRGGSFADLTLSASELKPAIVVLEGNSTDNLRLDVNNTEVGNPQLSSSDLNGLVVGSGEGGSRNAEMDVGEITVLEAHTQTELRNEKSRLAEKWGIILNYSISQNQIGSVSNSDGLQIGYINGDDLIDVANASQDTVYWFEQTADLTSWNQYTVSTGHTKIQGVNIVDVNGDGNKELFICDRDDDSVSIIQQDSGDPTGSWTSTKLATGLGSPQTSVIFDVDDDGTPEIIFTHAGTTNTTGVTLLDYTGGTVTDAANWDEYRIDSTQGAWWPIGPRDISGDGNKDDIVISSREISGLSNSGQLYYLSPPSDPTNTWNKTQIDDGSTYSPFQATMGNYFGTDDRDLVVAARTTGDGVYAYDFDNGYARTEIISTDTYYNVKLGDIVQEDYGRDDLFVAKENDYSGLRVYNSDTDSYELNVTVNSGQSNKIDDRIIPYNLTGDGGKELILCNQTDSALDWWGFS